MGIVGEDRSRADDDDIDMGADAVEMIEPCLAVDVAGLSAHRRDAAVERLAELRHDERPVQSRLAEWRKNCPLMGFHVGRTGKTDNGTELLHARTPNDLRMNL